MDLMNLIGQRFGRLTVIDNSKTRKGYVLCRCDCGNVKEIRANSLTKQKQPTRSCGCIRSEYAKTVGASTIAANSEKFLYQNRQYNTNFHTIESTKLPKTNRSGCKGVCWNTARNKWDAYITVHGTHINLGRFSDKDTAVKARKAAEDKYFSPIIAAKNSTK